MKIGFSGLDIPEGKIKYNDKILKALSEKDNPKKVSPFFAEFIKDEYLQSEAIVVHQDHLLDILILDMDKIETRINRCSDDTELKILKKCLKQLEDEIPLCEVCFNENEITLLNELSPHSYKPVIQISENLDSDKIIELVMEKSGYIFFYTSGPSESHAWLTKKDSDIVTCASKIHSDLARGFIKGDVVSFEEYLNYHNFNECKSKGIARVVDRDYIVQPNEVIEIRFNV